MRGIDNDVGGGQHRRREPYRARHRHAEETNTASQWVVRRPAAATLLVSIAIGSLSLATDSVTAPETHSTASDVMVPQLVDRLREPASRSMDRETPLATTAPGQTPTPQASSSPAATPSPPTSPKPSNRPATKPSNRPATTASPRAATTASTPRPVGGLTQTQMNYAAIIVSAGQQLQLPQRAYVVAIATALQESGLLNLANWSVPESLNLAHDGVGGDHDSVGLFQQRPSSGWGTVAELMDPASSARKFYQALMNVVGWESMSIAAAAQAVQVSAFPDAYAQQEALATLIVNALIPPT